MERVEGEAQQHRSESGCERDGESVEQSEKKGLAALMERETVDGRGGDPVARPGADAATGAAEADGTAAATEAPAPTPATESSVTAEGQETAAEPHRRRRRARKDAHGRGARGTGVPRMEGHLYKWTNYLKGWQRRLFVLENGVLSYYAERGAPLAPGEEEVPASPVTMLLPGLRTLSASAAGIARRDEAGPLQTVCRGRINLQLAVISSHDSDPARIAIDTGTQIYHLRADSNELCKQWVKALQQSKAYFERLVKRAAGRRMRAMVKQAEQQQEGVSPAGAHKSAAADASSEDEHDAALEFGEEDAATLQALQSRDELLAELVRVQSELRHALTQSGELDTLRVLQETLAASNSSVVNKDVASAGIVAALVDLITWGIHVLNADDELWKHRLANERGRAMRAETEAASLQRQLDELLRELEHSQRTESRADGKSPVATEPEDDEFFDAGAQVSPRPDGRSPSTSPEPAGSVSRSTSRSLSDRRLAVQAALRAPARTSSDTSRRGPSRAMSTAGGGVWEPRKRLPISDRDTPPKPSLWSILKDAIGKDLSKISIPVVFNEPISFLQRLVEDVEASYLLDVAARTDDPGRRLLYVAALAVSHYSSTLGRTGKPFNPLLGETFEYVSPDGHSLRMVCEQVSHHPPVSASHAVGRDDAWTYSTTCEVRNKFWGKSVEVFPRGTCHVRLRRYDDHITYEKATTCVHNILVGRMWIDNYGEMVLVNHTNGYRCVAKLTKTGAFWGSHDTYGAVRAHVWDARGRQLPMHLEGAWHSALRLVHTDDDSGRSRSETIWRRPMEPPEGASGPFHMTQFAIALNELTGDMRRALPPTDARLRPDQRLLENADYLKATSEKVRLEEKQRAARKQREHSGTPWTPLWFAPVSNEGGATEWQFTGAYWESRARGEWRRCPDIF